MEIELLLGLLFALTPVDPFAAGLPGELLLSAEILLLDDFFEFIFAPEFAFFGAEAGRLLFGEAVVMAVVPFFENGFLESLRRVGT